MTNDTVLGKDSAPQVSEDQLEHFSYDDKIVRMFLTAMLVWGIVAFLVGLIVAIELFLPSLKESLLNGVLASILPAVFSDMFVNLIDKFFSIEYLTFARLRPLHTNAAIFAFAGNAIFAAVYYSTQRLCKARMWSDKLSKMHFWGWQLIIVSAALTLPLGITQSKEYAELEWPIDIAIAVVWLGIFGGNFMMTVLKRRERHMYVSIWFYIATIVTVALLHVFNNLVVPSGFLKSYPIYAGVQDAFMQWWYGHNAVAFFLTTPFLGLMYYFLPKAADRPVFSYRLSIIHFWSLVFIYIWAGPHHLHYTALPDWASSLGMLFSLMLWMPSWGGMINGLLTLRGAWHKVLSDPVLKFFVVAITFYGMSTFEGPLLSIKSVNALSHYTDWTIAHVHAGALGWNGFMAFGMLYWLAPRIFQAKLWSQKMANAHFWMATIGILLYVLSIYVAGLTQGLMWRAIDDNGQLQYADFIVTIDSIIPMYYVRALGGGLFLVGALACAFNYFMTWKNRPAKYDEPTYAAAPLKKVYEGKEATAEARLEGVADMAKAIDKFNQFKWHRRWERLPVRFTIFVVISVVVASLFEIIPTFLIRSNVPTIASVKPYTPLELAGRDVYIAEGCYNCHSQMIRPIFAEELRYGEYSKPGEFVYDHPHQWGSRRIGPDLAREGVTRPSAVWHYRHFLNPPDTSPRSVMPPYPWLFEKELAWSSIKTRVWAMRALGVPYSDEEYANARELAEEQAKDVVAKLVADAPSLARKAKDLEKTEGIALIAYLQRLGTDITKEVDEDAADVKDTANEVASDKEAKPEVGG
ncbi:cytochrome-c oxidase, cbb3-type subunit I [Planctomycetota bacterium]|nr:cytochrome-c oxidase, cbb3-type subunit I [Planctomycetota bacterium]